VKKKDTDLSKINLLELTPVHNIKWEKTAEGLIVLLKPKFKNPFMVKYILPYVKRPYFRVKLDEIGSHLWDNCDGRRLVKDIARLQQQKFGDKVEPLYERISIFLKTLEQHRFITFKELSTYD
jgi:hypothetical protein